jgi:hypothetical protein
LAAAWQLNAKLAKVGIKKNYHATDERFRGKFSIQMVVALVLCMVWEHLRISRATSGSRQKERNEIESISISYMS